VLIEVLGIKGSFVECLASSLKTYPNFNCDQSSSRDQSRDQNNFRCSLILVTGSTSIYPDSKCPHEGVRAPRRFGRSVEVNFQ
jgi:hypothetical protein